MGIGRRLKALFTPQRPRELDPSEMVDLETADFSNGPIIVAALKQAGIDAETVDAFDRVTARTRARIRVRRSDLAAADDAMKRIR